MNLGMPADLGGGFKSAMQKARVISEAWVHREGYCPSCLSTLAQKQANAKAVDFSCQRCGLLFQLKSTKGRLGTRVPDGAYETMLAAIRSDSSPALMLMRYDQVAWCVRDLVVLRDLGLLEHRDRGEWLQKSPPAQGLRTKRIN